MQRRRYVSVWILLALVAGILAGGMSQGVTHAQTPTVYFPETGHYLGGAFRSFWDRHGGLDVFGFPVTEEYVRNSDGRVVQHFERARFELTVQGSQGIVQLGRIGAETLTVRGLGFPPVAPFRDTSSRRYFPETGHSLQGSFKRYWESRGGLELFGYPLSEETPELLPDGQQRTVQYFERARFELHGSQIKLGLLGTPLAPCQLRPGLPPNAPPSGPLPEGDSSTCASIPNTIASGRVYPSPSAPGTVLGFQAWNYLPGEFVSMWLNLPDGRVRSLPYQAIADDDGGVLIGFRTEANDPEGQWSLVGQGTTSGRIVAASFRLQR